ncbi:MAG: hypothetical protein PHF86_10880 [Candidatus Nanoarchaeia archaeon]|jgi:hypothetical protein|nr:hypothetical protein [Candidatus Nanoarchaeia archaeon]
MYHSTLVKSEEHNRILTVQLLLEAGFVCVKNNVFTGLYTYLAFLKTKINILDKEAAILAGDKKYKMFSFDVPEKFRIESKNYVPINVEKLSTTVWVTI